MRAWVVHLNRHIAIVSDRSAYSEPPLKGCLPQTRVHRQLHALPPLVLLAKMRRQSSHSIGSLNTHLRGTDVIQVANLISSAVGKSLVHGCHDTKRVVV